MFEKNIYVNRRKKLTDKMQSGVGLFSGNDESPMNYAGNTYKYRQDSSFLYFFGLDFPGLTAIIDFDSGEEIIFGDDVEIEDIIWMGPQVTIKENAAKVGVGHTAPMNKLEEFLQNALKKGRKIHYLPSYRADNKIKLEALLGIPTSKLQDYVSVELIKAVVDLRSVKEPCEIEELKIACATGYEMHVTAMKMAQPGVWEQHIAGTIEGVAAAGGSMISFPIILSQNGETLHNHDHSQYLEKGRLMLTDAGAETTMHYASDFTRTVPVGGKFSQKQREIYEIVLAANNEAAKLTTPGVTYKSVHLAAAEVIASGLKDLGIMKGNVKEAVSNGAHALFFPHGLGHMMGLDVHDMEDLGQNHVGFDEETPPSTQFGLAALRLGRRLEPGFVITNEPGIYFIPALIEKWKNGKINTDFINFEKLNEYLDFGGIRLEDDLLVTDLGCEIIGERVPIDPDEVEKVISE